MSKSEILKNKCMQNDTNSDKAAFLNTLINYWSLKVTINLDQDERLNILHITRDTPFLKDSLDHSAVVCSILIGQVVFIHFL